jgi:hypothetical protein
MDDKSRPNLGAQSVQAKPQQEMQDVAHGTMASSSWNEPTVESLSLTSCVAGCEWEGSLG